LRLVFAVFAAGLTALPAACAISADYDGTAYTCEDGRCPAGFRCVDRRCLDDDASVVDDASLHDAPLPDATTDADTCVYEPRSDTCQPPELEDLDLVAQTGGQTVCGSTTGNTTALSGCTGAPQPAADSIFRFAASTGQLITATLRPMGFNGAVYLLTDCSGQCLAIADALGVGGTESVQFTATTTGDHYAVVDSGTGTGAYELTVAVE
jgi:hypothetical protein